MALKIHAVSGTALSVLARNRSVRADLILLTLPGKYAKAQALEADTALDGMLSRRMKSDEFDPRDRTVRVIDTDLTVDGLNHVVLVGLGNRTALTRESLRAVLIDAFSSARDAGAERLVLPLLDDDLKGLDQATFARTVAEVATLIDYEPNHHKTRPWRNESQPTRLKSLTLVVADQARLAPVKTAVTLGQKVANATNQARDWVNEPSDSFTPAKLGRIARQIARDSKGLVKCRVLNKAQIKKLGMGAFLAVNAGSKNPPVLIEMRYDPASGQTDEVLGLVGKGITFDSGGLGIKDGDGMRDMKGDMGGAAAVLATMSLIPLLKPHISVRAVVAATENLIGPTSMRPGDVVTAMNGLTIEIAHTDAEGRLTLADALHYIQTKCGATRVVDLATLTGSVEEALGSYVSGVFSNDKRFTELFLKSAAEASEPMHELPMFDAYRDGNRSDMADLNNDGSGPGSIVAAWFLREFVQDDVPWIHVDIGGTAFHRSAHGIDPVGASGVGVRTLVTLLTRY